MTNYRALSLAEIEAELAAIAHDTRVTFGRLDAGQLNWRPTAASWSVAQCLDHLLRADHKMLQALDAAVDGSRPPAWWQRLPFLPGLFGVLMIKSQMPGATGKFTAPQAARPSSSALDPGIVGQFVAHQEEAAARVRSLDDGDARRIIMISPFVSFITYSVLDGCRLLVAHERRHVEQARRVTEHPGFPASTAPAPIGHGLDRR